MAFTACVHHRFPLFTDTFVRSTFADILLESADWESCDVVVYCFMLDHLHAILRGRRPDSDVKRAFVGFKQRSAQRLVQLRSDHRWQKDFYDHVLRDGEDWRLQTSYILENPVRAGLIDDPRRYEGSGSGIMSLDELYDGLHW